MSSGSLSKEDLTAIWTSAVDEVYLQPLLEQGEGKGLEVHTQAHAQYARVSKAIDQSTQALYIKAWSGQTSEPALGDQKATVTLTFSRAGLLTEAVTLSAGFTVQESTNDASATGSIAILTGRKYIITQDLVFGIGIQGPLTVQAIAERPGTGFNNPLPGTITSPVQLGSKFFNNLATVTVSGTIETLIVDNQPDVVIPEHVGQYVQFTGGTNASRIHKILTYSGPQPAIFPPNGGSVILQQSGAPLTPESSSASWRILDWITDWGFSITNTVSPTGGRIGMLDALGEERAIRRLQGEPDDVYADRVSTIADVVTPNAIIRAANRILAPYGIVATLREVGSEALPGFYHDGNRFSVDPVVAFPYDLNFTIRPEDRFKLLLDERLSMRAFFLICLPNVNISDFGWFYDGGYNCAYDTAPPHDSFLDGYARGTAILYKQVWGAVNEVKAAGVGFELILDG